MIERNRFFTEPPQRTRTVNVDDGWAEPRTPRDTPVTSEAVGEGAIADPSRHQEDSVAQEALVPKDYSNLLEDGSFERQQTRDALAGGWVGDDTVAAEGAWSVKVVTDGNTHETNLLTGVPVYPGERVYLVGRVRSAGGAGAPELFWMEAVWRDADGNVLSTSGWSQPVDNLLTWTAHEEVALAPPGVATFDVRLRLEAVPAGRTVWFDAAEVRRMLAFKSAVDGSRLEIDGDGLRLYDASGNQTVNLDADTGDASFKGAITGGSLTVTNQSGAGTVTDIRDGEGVRWLDLQNNVIGRIDANRVSGDNVIVIYSDYPNQNVSDFHGSVDVVASPDSAFSQIYAAGPGAESAYVKAYAGDVFSTVEILVSHPTDATFSVFSDLIELLGEPTGNSRHARGILKKATSTSPFTIPGTSFATVLTLSNVTLKSGRQYKLCADHGGVQSTAGNRVEIEFRDTAGTQYKTWNLLSTASPGMEGQTHTALLEGNGTFTFEMRARISVNVGSATTLIRGASTIPIQFWIEDIGPVPS